ncbi:MAG: hypothetical protein JW984_01695 [Deltaproteobacteria bacterium]|uniref:Uncharacterized protein n=1 Tax=Candidatus Zymogenus saltonus TaxID=2844893 RepID=A0A9D8KD50_9DELT|nr:hypothetical protein [Candidatus Zymogenus saltonus]
MTVLDSIYNPFVDAIVGGILALIIGGLILLINGKFNFSNCRELLETFAKLLLFGFICSGLGGLIFGVFKPGFFSFNIQAFETYIPGLDEFIHLRLLVFYAVDIFVRTCLFSFCAGGIFLEMFFNIGFYDLIKR